MFSKFLRASLVEGKFLITKILSNIMYLQSCIIEIALSIFLYDPDLLLRQAVEVVNQAVDPAVGGGDLALEVGLFVFRPGGGELPVEGNHLFDQGKRKLITD